MSPIPPKSLAGLLSFRIYRELLLLLGALGLVLAGVGVYGAGLPVWGGTLVFLGVVAVPVGLKWWDDFRRLGAAAFVLSALLMLQGFHFLEHTVQMVQYYLFNRPPILSQGLISSLNVEWVHFLWNVFVLSMMVFLLRRGLRGFWGWALLGWTTAHTLEHTYLLLRYLQLQAELGALGLSGFQVAQALPGILGRDGWLAENNLCTGVPGLTTLPRVAIHFLWNLGETGLLLLAAHTQLARLIQPR
ncbi:hypothetical protein [Meiothermus sp.]|uniref:hypothetical protein n=1 Tax=Meiothermus sp. TaxID=1955249 RepID=UPI0021DD6F74|nr:hypothetical protein [Meiothermus sp.]GIW23903.1 MAG: hypothetical protein KatS3mg069_0170 [Meiothermus sp.]